MGSNGASSGGNTGPANKYSTPAKKVVDFVKSGGIAGSVVRGITGAIKTEHTKSKQNKMDYEGQAAGVTPMGSPSNFTGGNGGDNNNSNTVVPLTTTTTTATAMSPTTAEVSQSSATDATDITSAEDILLKKKKTKATGRSMTILTSSKGVKSDEGLTLGKKSLLGA